MSEKGPRKVSSELRDYYTKLRTGDAVDEIIGHRRRRTRRLAEGAMNTHEVVDSTAIVRRYQRADGTVANLGPNYIKPRDAAKETETGEQEKNDE